MAETSGGSAGAAAERSAGTGGLREYGAVVATLAVLTLVELGVARTGTIARGAAVTALALLAVAKAALIALFFMHLRSETRILKLTVFVPLLAPSVYGLVLMADAFWRHLR